MTLPYVPGVQSWLAGTAASALSHKLGTEVSIGRVTLGMFNRVILDDLIIKDQQQDDLLRVNRLSVRLELLPLAEGNLAISSAQLFGAHARLYQKDSLSLPNYQFVIDSLSSNDTTTSNTFQLRLNSLIIRKSSFSYDKQFIGLDNNVFSPNHIKVTDISSHIILKTLSEDSLNMNVKRLAFKEQSGLDVRRLSLKLEIGRYGADLTDFYLELPQTLMRSKGIYASYDADRLKETLHLSGQLSDSEITPADFSCFARILEHYTVPLSVNTTFSGPLSRISVSQLKVSSDQEELELLTGGWVNLQAQPLSWYADVKQLFLSNHLFSLLQRDLSLPDQLSRLGYLSLAGNVSGRSDGTVSAIGDLRTEVGNVAFNLDSDSELNMLGSVQTQDFDLYKLLGNTDLGKFSARISFSGSTSSMDVNGDLSLFEYRNYPYKNISLDAFYSTAILRGKLAVHDPHIQTEVEGFWQRSSGQHGCKLQGEVSHLAPAALHLSNQWGDAVFSGAFQADFTASNINDAQGSVQLDGFQLVDSLGIYRIDRLLVKSGYDSGVHFLQLTSDVGEAELKGNFDWETLPQSFINFVADKLPTLPGLPATNHRTNNDFQIKLRLVNTEWMKRLLGIPLVIEKPLTLQADVEDGKRSIDIRGQVPLFTFNNNIYKGGMLSVTMPNDTLYCELMVSKEMADGELLDLKAIFQSSDNKLYSFLKWENHNHQGNLMAGNVKAIVHFYQDGQGKPEAHLRILPSDMVIANKLWRMEPCDILYSVKNLYIDHFKISNGQHSLLIHGFASENSKDTLAIDMNEMEVAYVLDLVNFHSVEFSGEATGHIGLSGVFDNLSAWANLEVEKFRFEGGNMGTLHAHAQWNEEEQQIDIDAIANAGDDALTSIKGYVSPPRDYIDLHIEGKGTPIDFLHTYTNSFLSTVVGHAYGDVRLVGPLGAMDLLGDLSVTGETKVTVLGTTYQLLGDTVHLVHDDIRMDRLRFVDRDGHLAYLSGGIHHQNLSSLTFDLYVETPKLLAYDTHDFDDSSFYGTVYTQGEVDLHGRPGEVTINCQVTPLQDTRFTYNVVSADAISNQEFITWRTKTDTLKRATAHPFPSIPVANSQSTDVRINFMLDLTPDAEVRLLMDDRTDDYISLHGSGNIRASFYNKGPFQMFGTYTVSDGTYDITIQDIIRKRFTFQNGGTVTFGGNPFNANLDLQAQYTVNSVSLSDLNIGNSFTNNTVRVICLMNILGQAGAPRVEFDLDMPTVSSDEKQMIRSVIASEQELNQQVLYLLGIGRFYTQNNNNAESVQQYSQTQLAMQSFLSGTVSSQINGVLSQVINSNDWNFGANISTGDEGWRNAEYEGLISGRMLNNRLLINGQFGYRDNAARQNPSFIGDFDIRYLLYPNGNLALKVYNQTNDRYFTHSSLNTQGIGLIMKRDFNSLRDLFSIRRKKSVLSTK